jgi:DNA-directed RNA polymerase specialized sigma24 family protein
MVSWKECENKATLELIELIKMRKEQGSTEVAEAAFIAFTFRFRSEISKKCEIICKSWGQDADFASEVSIQTFERFWKYPNFDPSKCKTKSIDQGVLVYLFRIAQHVLADLWNEKHNTKINPYDGSEEIVWDFPISEENDCGEIDSSLSQFSIIKKALEQLSEKHKIVFLTYTKYSKDGFKLPRKLLAQMRGKLNISQQTIRSYKNEADNKIKEYLKLYEKK